MFTSDQKQFYRNICGDTVDTLTPNEGEAIEFCSGIWGRPIAHNGNSEWIKMVQTELSDVEKPRINLYYYRKCCRASKSTT